MVKDGLYKVSYKGSLGEGYGLVHLSGGKIHGGDAMIYYTGTYSVFENGAIQGKVKGAAYVDGAASGMASLFVENKNTIELTGTVTASGKAKVEARSKQVPGIALQLELEFLAE